MVNRDQVKSVAYEETIGSVRGAFRLIVAAAAIWGAAKALGLPLPASVGLVEELRKETTNGFSQARLLHRDLNRVVWTDKLLAYEARMDELNRKIRVMESLPNTDVPPVYWHQKTMLNGQIQEARRRLNIWKSSQLRSRKK